MTGAPRSEQFDDVYFSADNGLEETRHVFIDGNGLKEAVRGARHFTIAETGFGTGLNFLVACCVFEDSAPADAQLDFISFEKYPLSAVQIAQALAPFRHYLGEKIDHLVRVLPPAVPGFHRVQFSARIHLTLIHDDVNEAIGQVGGSVDCWFLDGFTPSKNPQMWTDTVFQGMAWVSAPGARFATFTAAGFVRRGLEAAGFEVCKQKGFGRKRDMLAGRYRGAGLTRRASVRTAAIIGGGLAGTACAFALQQRGIRPVIYERGERLAGGASGNALGLYNPRFSALRGAESDFYTAAFFQCLRTFPLLGGCAWRPDGGLHLITSEEKRKRFYALHTHWAWPGEELCLLDAAAASDVAGIGVDVAGLYLPRSGSVAPRGLCDAYADGVEIRYGGAPESLADIKEDAVILANGADVLRYVPWLPVHTVRGQVSAVHATALSSQLKCNLHFGGYVSRAEGGAHMVGATFQKWLTHCDILPQDHADNIARLKDNVPALSREEFTVTGGRASLRTSSSDRFPVIGVLPGLENTYVSTAHASHGIVSSLAGAVMIADLLSGAPLSLPAHVQKALSPQRFIDRDARRQGAKPAKA